METIDLGQAPVTGTGTGTAQNSDKNWLLLLDSSKKVNNPHPPLKGTGENNNYRYIRRE